MEEGNNLREETHTFDVKISKLLKIFKININTILSTKRSYLEAFVNDSIQKTSDKVSETFQAQMEEKEKTIEEFKTEFYTMAQQATDELKKMKQVEEKVENLLKLKEKGKEKERKTYFHQLQEFKKLNEEFSKDMHDLELNQSKQCAEVLDELRKDISQLQKKILMDTQQREMGNIRKHLKQSLF